jgi:hypothetical protein
MLFITTPDLAGAPDKPLVTRRFEAFFMPMVGRHKQVASNHLNCAKISAKSGQFTVQIKAIFADGRR